MEWGHARRGMAGGGLGVRSGRDGPAADGRHPTGMLSCFLT